ncbi:hypothetical protein PG2022B_0583 [Bifidobacterium animalis subsp. animalis]|nr:hypothetical protein PG2022B_0583 [Bifidobacterium animalis subsp. animalis]
MNPNENNGAQPSNDLPPYAQPTPAQQPAQGSPSPQGQQPAYANAQSAPQQPQSAPQTPHAAPQFAQGAPAGTTTVDVKESVNKFADSLGKQHLKIGNYEVAYGNLVTVVGALLAVIGVFLPFATVNVGMMGVSMSQSVSLMPHGDGWILLIGAVVIAVLAVLRQEIAALTVTIIYALLVIYEIANAGSKLSQLGEYRQFIHLSYGAGMWLLIIAIIVMLIGTIFAFYNKQRAKNPQNGAPAMPVQNPAYDASYQNNGWQFGVPAQRDPSNVDNSQWQFGVENPPAGAGAQQGTPMAPDPSAAAPVPPAVAHEPFNAAPAAPATPAAPAAPAAPMSPAAPAANPNPPAWAQPTPQQSAPQQPAPAAPAAPAMPAQPAIPSASQDPDSQDAQ